jgi:hypothetical protein
MQELGLLEEGTNISNILEDYKELNQEIEIETTNDEIENQMVVGEYYTDEGGQNE